MGSELQAALDDPRWLAKEAAVQTPRQLTGVDPREKPVLLSMVPCSSPLEPRVPRGTVTS